jgi:hypothetical protein
MLSSKNIKYSGEVMATKHLSELEEGDTVHRTFPFDEYCKINKICDHYDETTHNGKNFYFFGFIVPQAAMRKMFNMIGSKIEVA